MGRAIFLFAGGTCDNFKEFKDQTFIFGKQQKQISDNTGNTSTDENDVSTPMPAVPPPITGNTSTDENDVSTDENDVSRRRAKLGDFISRLRGYLNVQDINPKLKEGKKEYEELDFPLKLRRAVILRSLLERFAKPIFHPERTGSVEVASIDDQVISKLLNAKKYKHGVRSMEAVVQMSRWIEGEFVPASLPADDQFELHIELGDTQEKPVKA